MKKIYNKIDQNFNKEGIKLWCNRVVTTCANYSSIGKVLAIPAASYLFNVSLPVSALGVATIIYYKTLLWDRPAGVRVSTWLTLKICEAFLSTYCKVYLFIFKNLKVKPEQNVNIDQRNKLFTSRISLFKFIDKYKSYALQKDMLDVLELSLIIYQKNYDDNILKELNFRSFYEVLLDVSNHENHPNKQKIKSILDLNIMKRVEEGTL